MWRNLPVDFGVADLVLDATGGRTLLVDGVEQSHVAMDPTRLRFEYTRRLARAVDAAAPAGVPLRVLHLGGGALTLPRYVAATRPGSAQTVVDRDARLMALVRRALPPPPGVRVDIADALDALDAAPDAGYDVVLSDVYGGAHMPERVTGRDFAAHAARVAGPRGLYAVNVTDLPPLVLCRRQVATLRTAFADVCLIAARTMLRGRRYGNVVLAATNRPGGLPVAALTATAARDEVRGRVLHGADLDAFVAGTSAAD
ncbi:spermidine synthase [Rhizomonospora bruguierae]|uniref:spermidine synthase n=1 Tax=Rhizomonospora bruguierae TaxID=1581705 RepID=UPI001BCB21A8|nr:fused MFS/spermidine synthase [Micromonospora sp. NBRC 107566]